MSLSSLQQRLSQLRKQPNSQSPPSISKVDLSFLLPQSEEERVAALLVVAYLFHSKRCGSSDENYQRVRVLCVAFLGIGWRLPSYPSWELTCSYPCNLYCNCGAHITSDTWGMREHCDMCQGKLGSGYNIPMFADAMVRYAGIPRCWSEWAESVITCWLLEKKLKEQTIKESLLSEI